jgi:hypothetical protein
MNTVDEVLKDYKQNYKEHFQHSLLSAKTGLIAIFILITLVYQTKYRKLESAQTFFGTSSSSFKFIGGALLSAVLGMLSVVFVIISRAGTGAIKRNINNILVVGGILFLFTIARESSGFNRWLARKETLEGHGAYAEISKEKYNSNNRSHDYEKELEEEKNCDSKGDPFLDSICSLSLILLGIGLVYFIGKIILATYYGFKSGQNNISSLPGMFEGKVTPLLGFSIELFIVGLLNATILILMPIIKGEGYNPLKKIVFISIFIIAVSLHVMLQYTGMLKGF